MSMVNQYRYDKFWLFDLNFLRPINNVSVNQGRVFLGWTSTKLGKMCFAQGPQRSDAGEARTRGPSVSSQALYHLATALPQVWWLPYYNMRPLCAKPKNIPSF